MARENFNQLYRYLDTNGDGSGDKNANGDYSLAEEIFYLQPAATEKFEIHRMIILIEDGVGFTPTQYGSLGAALANGLSLRVQDDTGIVTEITNGLPITTNVDWGRMAFDVDVKKWAGGNETLVCRFTFAKSGSPLVLNGNKNERLELVANDNLTGLVKHYFFAQGIQLEEVR